MTTARNILIEAMRRRILLLPAAGGSIAVKCAVKMPPDFDSDFADVLRQHKPALLKLLCSKRHLAKQVMADEFTGADDATWYSIIYSLLDNYYDPLCGAAIEHLKASQSTISRHNGGENTPETKG
jgi:hypothetical protein